MPFSWQLPTSIVRGDLSSNLSLCLDSQSKVNYTLNLGGYFPFVWSALKVLLMG